MPIDILRTPEERFDNLVAFPYSPHYLEDLPGFEGLRLHYLDEGRRNGPTFLCLHGEPTWAYLYRKMLGVFVAARGRVVAPDFFGFGRSDKPTDDRVYTWDFHRRCLLAVIERLDLKNITLVCQDWGGLLGLTLPMEMPERFSRLLVMNTALATGKPPSDGFLAWRAFVQDNPDLDVAALMQRAVPGISAEECEAYGAPFVDVDYKAGVRRFPDLVPVRPDMDGAECSSEAAAWLRVAWDGPSFMAVGTQDPVLGLPVMRQLRDSIRGCPEPLLLNNVGHFVQERGVRVAQAALDAWGGR